MLLRYLDLWKQTEKNAAFLRNTIDKNSDCQDWKQKKQTWENSGIGWFYSSS